MSPGRDTKRSTNSSFTKSHPLTTKSHGGASPRLGRNFETVNALDLLHTEAESLSKSAATTIMEMRVLDTVIENQQMTRIEIAKVLVPDRPHVVFYAVDNLYDRGMLEQWQPGRSVSKRAGRPAHCYRLTQRGERAMAGILADLDTAFGELFRSERAKQLVAAVQKAQQ